MQGDSTVLHVHTLDSTISVRIPLLCLGYGDLIENELRRRYKLTSIDAVCLYITLLVYLSTMTVRTRVEIIGKKTEEAQSTISRPCAVSVTNIQSLQELLHLLEGDSTVGGIILILGKKMFHAELTEILRRNHGSIARFQGSIISYTRQFLTVQDELDDFSILSCQSLKVCFQNGFQESDSI